MCRTLLTVVTGLVMAIPAAAATYVVSPDGNGDYPTIQAAIDAAADGDVVELTDGVFMGDGNRDVDYLGKAITVLSQSGDPEACVVDCQGSLEEYHIGFRFTSGEGLDAVLEGITITNGVAQNGGGALFVESSPTIRNVIFLENHAGPISGIDGSGGAFLAYDSAYPEFTDCQFLGNSCEWAGGAVCVYFFAGATLTNCTFYDNWSDGPGTAVFNYYGCSVTLNDCTVAANTNTNLYEVWSFLFHSYFSNLELDGCSVADNSSELVLWHNGWDLTLEDTIIAFNDGAAFAGAVTTSSVTCTNIYGNAGGDWIEYGAPYFGVDGNISEDPLFCNADNRVFNLQTDSPSDADCGLMGAWPVGCPWLDVLPDDCPNELDVASRKGKLPVAIMGADYLDVMDIDPSSVRLEGVAPLQHNYEDVNGLLGSKDPCACAPEWMDGWTDMTLKFSRGDVLDAIEGTPGNEYLVTLSWEGTDGTPYESSDCVMLVEEVEGRMAVTLLPAEPNPLNPVTTLRYSLPEAARVQLVVYDVSGRRVRDLFSGTAAPGTHGVVWDGSDDGGRHVASGTYFYELRVDGRPAGSQKLIVLK